MLFILLQYRNFFLNFTSKRNLVTFNNVTPIILQISQSLSKNQLYTWSPASPLSKADLHIMKGTKKYFRSHGQQLVQGATLDHVWPNHDDWTADYQICSHFIKKIYGAPRTTCNMSFCKWDTGTQPKSFLIDTKTCVPSLLGETSVF